MENNVIWHSEYPHDPSHSHLCCCGLQPTNQHAHSLTPFTGVTHSMVLQSSRDITCLLLSLVTLSFSHSYLSSLSLSLCVFSPQPHTSFHFTTFNELCALSSQMHQLSGCVFHIPCVCMPVVWMCVCRCMRVVHACVCTCIYYTVLYISLIAEGKLYSLQ